jgi:hypothetical protein
MQIYTNDGCNVTEATKFKPFHYQVFVMNHGDDQYLCYNTQLLDTKINFN